MANRNALWYSTAIIAHMSDTEIDALMGLGGTPSEEREDDDFIAPVRPTRRGIRTDWAGGEKDLPADFDS